MAHTGPPGKVAKHGRSQSAEWTDVVDVPYEGESPELPRVRGKRWPTLVERWWDNVRHMPHCVLWKDSDWDFALETAFLKMAFWEDFASGEVKSTLATEIRRREDQLGTTTEARRKLRIRYVEPVEADDTLPEPDEEAVVEDQAVAEVGVGTVTPLASRRRRLTA